MESYWNQQNGSGVDSDSALGLEELNPTPIPGGKWWSGVDSDSESRQNGVDSGFGVDSTVINYKSVWEGLKFCRSVPISSPTPFFIFSPDLGHFILNLQNFDIFTLMFYFSYSFWSDERSLQTLTAALADSAGCAGLCTDSIDAPQA